MKRGSVVPNRPSLPRQAEAPLPLLTHDLDLGRSFRDGDELVPHKQPRPQQGRDSHRGPDSERPLQPIVLRLVRARLPALCRKRNTQ